MSIPPKSSLKRQLRIFKLPEDVSVPGFRKMTKKDAPQVQVLLDTYLKRFVIHPELSLAEVKHMIVPKDNIVDSYVVEDEEKNITDMISIYFVPCSVLKHKSIKEYKVGLRNTVGGLHLLLRQHQDSIAEFGEDGDTAGGQAGGRRSLLPQHHGKPLVLRSTSLAKHRTRDLWRVRGS